MSFLNIQTKKAVAYYRHSAEDKQENSVPIQREHVQKFAKENNIEIIHEEADEGKTGLLADRPGFCNLFDSWICNPKAPAFDYVLVYDVSRWGRFQDQNEPAYYEFRCKQYSKKVIYVSRGFPQKEQQLISHLQTSIERYMAAEYSRQLSEKVFYGCAKVSQDGYSAGGTPCYGMGRLLLDSNKKPVRILKFGEHKAIANDRIKFVPLNDKTTKTIKLIFKLFVKDFLTATEISAELNRQKIPTAKNKKWDERKIYKILTNQIYIGNHIYNKTSNRLKSGRKNNPEAKWIICKQAFLATIDKTTFIQAQQRLYWQLNSCWKKNYYKIRKVEKNLRQELKFLYLKKDFSDKKITKIVKNLPIVFSVSTDDNKSKWCFTINEGMGGKKEILGIGINSNEEAKIHFFLIPTKDFGRYNFKFISENDENYKKYLIDVKDIKRKIIKLTA